MHGFGLTDRYLSFSCSSLYSLLQISPQVFCRATKGMYFISQTTQTLGAFHRFSVTLLLLSILIPLPKPATMQGSFVCPSDSTHSPDITAGKSKVPRSLVVPTVMALSIPSVRVTHRIPSQWRHFDLPGFQYGILFGLCVWHCLQNRRAGLASNFSSLSFNRSLKGFLVIPIPISSMIPPMDFLTHWQIDRTQIPAILGVICWAEQTTYRTLVDCSVGLRDLLRPFFCTTNRGPIRSVHPASFFLECPKSGIHLLGMGHLFLFICRIFHLAVIHCSRIHQ